MEHAATSWGRKAPIILALVTLLVYSDSFQAGFHLDDADWAIAYDLNQSPGRFLSMNSSRPLVAASMLVNQWLSLPGPFFDATTDIRGGYRPAGFHAFNLAIHIAAGLTLYAIARRLLRGTRGVARYVPADADALAFAIALLWLIHPLQTQAVTYIVQRCESMMGLFYLLTVYTLLRSEDSPTQRRLWLQASVLTAMLGAASKEVMATAPFVVVIFDRVFLASGWRQVFRERWGYYLALAGVCWALPALLVLSLSQSAAGVNTVGGVANLTPTIYLFTQAGVLVHYLRLCFWPGTLVIEYRDWPLTTSLEGAVLPGLVIVALLMATAWGVVRGRWYGFVGAWFFGILSVTSSVVPIVDVAFEHRMYLPLASVVTVAVLAVDTAARRYCVSFQTRRRVELAALIAVSVALGSRTYVRNLDYRDDFTLWTAALDARPGNAKAHMHLAGAAEDFRRYGLAERELALASTSPYPTVGVAAARLALIRDEPDKAKRHFDRDVRVRQDFESIFQLALVDAAKGDNVKAGQRLRSLIKASDYVVAPFLAYAVVLDDDGETAKANDLVAYALALNPDYASHALRRARLRLYEPFFNTAHGRMQALHWAKQAVRASVTPDPVALSTLAAAFAVNGRWDDAIRAAKRGIAASREDETERRRQLEAWIDCWRTKSK